MLAARLRLAYTQFAFIYDNVLSVAATFILFASNIALSDGELNRITFLEPESYFLRFRSSGGRPLSLSLAAYLNDNVNTSNSMQL